MYREERDRGIDRHIQTYRTREKERGRENERGVKRGDI